MREEGTSKETTITRTTFLYISLAIQKLATMMEKETTRARFQFWSDVRFLGL